MRIKNPDALLLHIAKKLVDETVYAELSLAIASTSHVQQNSQDDDSRIRFEKRASVHASISTGTCHNDEKRKNPSYSTIKAYHASGQDDPNLSQDKGRSTSHKYISNAPSSNTFLVDCKVLGRVHEVPVDIIERRNHISQRNQLVGEIKFMTCYSKTTTNQYLSLHTGSLNRSKKNKA